jgi:hypothetical protein
MIQDVDQLLERLVRRDALNGSGVDLLFDAPNKDWVARRSGPCVDLYLYDIREDVARRVPTWEDVRGTDGQVAARLQPHRRFRLLYLVTAWTQRPEDEHRLLSSLLLCFLRNPMLKPGDLGGSLDEAQLPVYIDVGQPQPEERSIADVWTALGGELKPSLDVVVTAPVVVGRATPFGATILETPTLAVARSEAVARLGAAEAAAGSPAPLLEQRGPRRAAATQATSAATARDRTRR